MGFGKIKIERGGLRFWGKRIWVRVDGVWVSLHNESVSEELKVWGALRQPLRKSQKREEVWFSVGQALESVKQRTSGSLSSFNRGMQSHWLPLDAQKERHVQNVRTGATFHMLWAMVARARLLLWWSTWMATADCRLPHLRGILAISHASPGTRPREKPLTHSWTSFCTWNGHLAHFLRPSCLSFCTSFCT